MYKIDSGYKKNRAGIRLFYEQVIPRAKDGMPPRGIIQIAHGMRESTGYYREVREALVSAGYGVFVHDARGHGRTAAAPFTGGFQKNAGEIGENGFSEMVDDLAELTDLLRDENPGVPVFLLGHSMGSVLARLYIARYPGKIDGVIFSGTTGPADPVKTQTLLAAAYAEAERLGRSARAVRTPQLLFGHFNDRFVPAATGYEYMSRDASMVREALESPFAAIPYRCGFFIDFITAMGQMDLPENLRRIPKELPIFSISGDMDPFGDFGKGVEALFALYHKYGLRSATLRIYRGGRHEMLRETNRKQVFADLVRWLRMAVPSEMRVI